ncbi:hypothetical protein BJV82DRAFT_672142 [Fennellomyces sp. T-0311]|nr:hypothetical protein BJV82DRAFT_672142 [Fennellomyces sp. T-0311]
MDILDSLLQAGEARILLSMPLIVVAVAVPIIFLALLTITKKLSTPVKQVLSTPLLTFEFLIPFIFHCGNGLIDLNVAGVCYNVFLRFFELFWIGPVLYGKEAYSPSSYLYTEFWSALCKFPKPNKKNDDEKPKEYVKDKKWYHIIMYLLFHMVICDVVGSYLSTFNGLDVMKMRRENRALFFVFQYMFVIVFNSAFNISGYTLQLLHCLVYDRGSYSSEQWRSCMMNPLMSKSLEELWSVRWHQLMHTSWVAFAFRPSRYITQRLLAKTVKNPLPIALLVGSLSVFFVSGMMHEYIIYANLGWSVYSRLFIGQQVFYFYIHGVGLTVEKIISAISKRVLPPKIRESWFVTQVVQRLWITAFSAITFPYFMDGFGYWALWNDNPFTFSTPYVKQLIQLIPNGPNYCGSLF